ncbi:MAG: hypothetical protein WBQ60_10875 [Asticcacaulis sp.]
MMSSKAKASAEKIKSLSEDEAESLADMIRHEVEHATHVLSERAKEAEAKLRAFADHAGDDAVRLGKDARAKIEDNPLPAVAIALGVGFVVGAMIASRK